MSHPLQRRRRDVDALDQGIRAAGDADLTGTEVTYADVLRGSRAVSEFHQVVPLLGCGEHVFRRVLPMLLHVEALVCRHEDDPGTRNLEPVWRCAVEKVLDVHGVKTAAVQRHLFRLQEFFQRESLLAGGEAERTEDGLRRLMWLRSSDVRMLGHALCAAEGRNVAEQVAQLLDAVLELRAISRDLGRCSARRGGFSVLEEYVALHGADRACERLRQQQERLVDQVLAFCGNMPRHRIVALWPALFGEPLPTPMRVLPGKSLVAVVQRRLADLDRAFCPMPDPAAGAVSRRWPRSAPG